jgi:hypothetical protein
MNSSSENPYGYGNSVQNMQAYSSPHHIPHMIPYHPYYGNFAPPQMFVRPPPHMSRKQMASPYKKRLQKNGGIPTKNISKEQQQIYSTFKPPNSSNEGANEGR